MSQWKQLLDGLEQNPVRGDLAAGLLCICRTMQNPVEQSGLLTECAVRILPVQPIAGLHILRLALLLAPRHPTTLKVTREVFRRRGRWAAEQRVAEFLATLTNATAVSPVNQSVSQISTHTVRSDPYADKTFDASQKAAFVSEVPSVVSPAIESPEPVLQTAAHVHDHLLKDSPSDDFLAKEIVMFRPQDDRIANIIPDVPPEETASRPAEPAISKSHSVFEIDITAAQADSPVEKASGTLISRPESRDDTFAESFVPVAKKAEETEELNQFIPQPAAILPEDIPRYVASESAIQEQPAENQSIAESADVNLFELFLERGSYDRGWLKFATGFSSNLAGLVAYVNLLMTMKVIDEADTTKVVIILYKIIKDSEDHGEAEKLFERLFVKRSSGGAS